MELADDAGQVENEECKVQSEGTPPQSDSPSHFSVVSFDVSSYVPRTLQEDLERR